MNEAFWEPEEQTVCWEVGGGKGDMDRQTDGWTTEASSQPRAGGSAAGLLWVISRSKNTHYSGESLWLESGISRLSSHAQSGAYAILLL